MGQRLNLIVDDATVDKLTELAGGPRKRGELISRLIDSMWAHRQTKDDALMDLLGFADLVGTVRGLDGRLAKIEQQLARLGTKTPAP